MDSFGDLSIHSLETLSALPHVREIGKRVKLSVTVPLFTSVKGVLMKAVGKNLTGTDHLFSLFLLICLLGTTIGCDGPRPVEMTNTAETSGPPVESPPSGTPQLRTVYVPAYSYLPHGKKHERVLFSILLSVRNVDSTAVVTLTHVDYFDTSGHRVRRYLKSPKKLRPLETAEFKVETQDDTGGSGANFLVFWEGPSDAHPLLTEAVMWGYLGGGYTAFTSRGIELDRRPTLSDEVPNARNGEMEK